jgi:hypothetical protein
MLVTSTLRGCESKSGQSYLRAGDIGILDQEPCLPETGGALIGLPGRGGIRVGRKARGRARAGKGGHRTRFTSESSLGAQMT